MTHVHFIGIGGSGLSAIARLLLESGYTVSGSDRALTPFAEEVRKAGATVYVGHHPRNLTGADWVVRSSAISEDNAEVKGAKRAGIPVYKRADFLGRLMEDKTGIAIAGTHGKTTTTAMTAWILSELGRDPSFIVGGVVNNLGVNAHAGKGKTFVIEADEYDNMFLGLKPQVAVVTSIEHDHPDFFPTLESMYLAFEKFVDLLPEDGTLIVCAEDAGAAALIPHVRKDGRNVVSYGMQSEMTINTPLWVQARAVKPNERGGFDFVATTNLASKTSASVEVSLQVPGQHNVRNALAVLAIVGVLGLSRKKAARALSEFIGTGRRFELRGAVNDISIFDDYAHHPTEIRATLSGARARFPKARIWAVWQPHTYSRTKTLFLDFARAFKDANEVIVTEVYAAREPEQEFTSAEIVSAMPHLSARYIKTLPEVTEYLLKHLQSGDVVLVLSAGDADQISTSVVKGLQER
ncbi:MAG TPA: UDP-N-acetylmuramate--L-alanine ligase [Anaerolineales bacterium]|nr:UDP-N-acetylmuramate--L-alanine ligase [Anaerolineales bacterium]HLO31910.1 UDP-N-acetylmuramate--L-alanine ligase [Anaerolineales bacterium]